MGTGYHAAKILGRRVVSPTVVVLDLELVLATTSSPSSSSLTFQAGQWLDVMAPPYKWIGGFSPASIPSDLPKITLAVKESSYAPGKWIHSDESKEIGRTIQIQAGGTSVLDTTNIQTQPVVFCAGGIGISPILSMYRQWSELLQGRNHSQQTEAAASPPSVSFLYSVSNEEELVFQEELMQTAASNKEASENLNQQLIFTLTQQKEWTDISLKKRLESQANVQCRTGRFMKEFLQSSDPTSAFYLCGPPAMLDKGVDILQKRGIDDKNIHFERWW